MAWRIGLLGPACTPLHFNATNYHMLGPLGENEVKNLIRIQLQPRLASQAIETPDCGAWRGMVGITDFWDQF